MRQIYGLFMKRDVVSEANTTNLLCQVDVSIDLGRTVTSKLAKLGLPAEEKNCNLKWIAKSVEKVKLKINKKNSAEKKIHIFFFISKANFQVNLLVAKAFASVSGQWKWTTLA